MLISIERFIPVSAIEPLVNKLYCIDQEQRTYELLSTIVHCPTTVNFKVLGSILSKRYPSAETLSFTSLFWPSWPKCLEVYGK